MTAYKIEKNVERPQWRGKMNFVDEMNIGESIFVLDQKEMDSIRFALRHRGKRASCRKMDGGYRIWRVS